MHFVQFVELLEQSISLEVQRAAPRSWGEDHITYNVLAAIRASVHGARIDGLQRPCAIAADAFKLFGKAEQKYGDVAVLVRLTSWDGDTLEGVGFLEAKKRHLRNHKFDQFKLSQAKKIERNAPRAQFLLYDAVNITGFSDNMLLPLPSQWLGGVPFLTVPKTNALCTPVATVVDSRSCTPSLYKYGVPLSLQLALRFFRGFDLHFGDRQMAAVRQFANRVNGGVDYVLAVGVAVGEGVPPSIPEVRGERLSGGPT